MTGGLGLWVLVAIAGAAGAVCRYVVDFVVSNWLATSIPFGTMVVNVSGSFLFGLVVGLSGVVLPQEAELVLAVGFCGSYTTFSTHMVESARLTREGHFGRVLVNVLGSLAAGVVAAVLGLWLATWVM